MSEIERAVKHFERLQKRYTTQHNGKHCELVKTTLEALLEKQKREKGCAVCSCEYHQELCAEVVRYHSSDFATQEKVDVHYCPVCGRRLEVEHEN